MLDADVDAEILDLFLFEFVELGGDVVLVEVHGLESLVPGSKQQYVLESLVR